MKHKAINTLSRHKNTVNKVSNKLINNVMNKETYTTARMDPPHPPTPAPPTPPPRERESTE